MKSVLTRVWGVLAKRRWLFAAFFLPLLLLFAAYSFSGFAPFLFQRKIIGKARESGGSPADWHECPENGQDEQMPERQGIFFLVHELVHKKRG